MPAGKPTLGYPTRTDAILALEAQGLSPVEIGRKLSMPPSSVSVLSAGGRRSLKRRDAEGFMRMGLVPVELTAAMKPHAEARGVSLAELARRILTAVLDDKIVDAVLDDGGKK